MSQMPEPGSAPTTASSDGAATRTPPPSSTRLAVAVLAGAAVATLGGFILGEYPFTGVTPYVAGILFALVVAEVILSIARRHDVATAVAAAACSAGGLALAVWISTGEGIDPIPIGGWMAIVIGLVVALFRGGLRPAGRRAQSSPPSS